MKKVDIFTDGACRGNPGPGGYGSIIRAQGKEKEISGSEKSTTNNIAAEHVDDGDNARRVAEATIAALTTPDIDFILDTLNCRRFLESDIWNGPAVRDFTESCYQNEDYSSAVKSWKYIQAFSLMDSFRKASNLGELAK